MLSRAVYIYRPIWGQFIGGISSYRVPLMDMLMFIVEKVDEGYVTLETGVYDALKSAYEQISDGRKQLEGENYDRILVYLNLPEESDETFLYIDEIHHMAQMAYERDDVYVVGNSTSQKDLRESFETDNIIVSIVSVLFVLVILLFTSGSMMILAGVFIARMTSDPCIAGIGECLGRGTTISVILVMFVLPQILLIGDRIIAATAFDVSMPIRMREERGTIVVNGAIRGTVNGTVVGTMNAVVRGEVQAVVVSGSMENASQEVLKPAQAIEDRMFAYRKEEEERGGGAAQAGEADDAGE